MLTNLTAVLTVAVVTNVYQPKQYWHPQSVIYCGANSPSYIEQSSRGEWRDTPPFSGGWWGQPTERPNPDARITEVREIRTLSFTFDGKEYTQEVSNTVLSSRKQRRVVQTEERWEEER